MLALGRWLKNGLAFIPSGPELPKLSGVKIELLPPCHRKAEAKENLVSPESTALGQVLKSHQCGLFPRALIPQVTLGSIPPFLPPFHPELEALTSHKGPKGKMTSSQ